jgi:hypothetical protein
MEMQRADQAMTQNNEIVPTIALSGREGEGRRDYSAQPLCRAVFIGVTQRLEASDDHDEAPKDEKTERCGSAE